MKIVLRGDANTACWL